MSWGGGGYWNGAGAHTNYSTEAMRGRGGLRWVLCVCVLVGEGTWWSQVGAMCVSGWGGGGDNWNSAGTHTNYSTEAMKGPGGLRWVLCVWGGGVED